jgi:SAM-dependent methyltransferase
MSEAAHPAKFSKQIIALLRALQGEFVDEDPQRFGRGARVLDPFAGTGRVHSLRPVWDTVGIELEPEWAAINPYTVVGSALALPFPTASFALTITSPTYGNRLADHHLAKDLCKKCAGAGTIPWGDVLKVCPLCKGKTLSPRKSYAHTLGRTLHPENSGLLHWGPAYRDFHIAAWDEVWRVTKPGGRFLLNISNHIRAKREVQVSEWHRDYLLSSGWKLLDEHQIETGRLRHGQNYTARVDHEKVYVLERS